MVVCVLVQVLVEAVSGGGWGWKVGRGVLVGPGGAGAGSACWWLVVPGGAGSPGVAADAACRFLCLFLCCCPGAHLLCFIFVCC